MTDPGGPDDQPPPPQGPQPGDTANSYGGPTPTFDELTRKVGGARSRRSVLRIGGAAVVAAVVAWFVWGRRGGGSECSTPSSCGDRQYCNEEETCTCTETTEGDLRCGQLPPYCYLPLCTSSADCSHLGEGWFCDTPNSGCCTDPPAELSRCIAPCGTEYPSEPMTTTTTTTTTAPTDPEEPEEPEVDDGEPSHLRLTATQPDGLLFFSRREDGSATYFYGEEVAGGSLRPTHVQFEESDGTTSTVIVDEDLLPIRWINGDLSIAVRPESRDTEVDTADAIHSIIIEAEESVLRVDLVPTDLDRVLDGAEELTGERYPDARQAFDDMPTEWAEVVDAAGEQDDVQPQRIANAVAASIAHAAVALIEAAAIATEDAPATEEPADEDPTTDDPSTDEDGPQGLRSSGALPGAVLAPPNAAQILPIYKLLSELLGPWLESMLKNALINVLAEETYGSPQAPTDPNAPAFDLLLCQGATSWGTICHYTYFDRSNISGCLDFCKTDLSCFTNICAPITLSVEDAMQTWDG